MSENGPEYIRESEEEASESLRGTLHELLGSAPAPAPRLSDEELLAEIREAAGAEPPADFT
jgi:hypothetical protein